MIIALIIFGYIIAGFGITMIYAFIEKRMGLWDKHDDPGFCVVLILFYPILVPTGLILFAVEGLQDFFAWFADCINEKEK